MSYKRHSALAKRHQSLGAELGEWNDMGVAWEYSQDVNDEHMAVRTAAALFDVSGLKKIHLLGPDALAVADHVVTRDMTKIPVGCSVYAIILNEEGGFTDDTIVFNLAPNHVFLVHGGGTAMEQVEKSAEGKNVIIQFDDDLHDISFQGPKAVDVLAPHTPIDIHALKYFHQQSTTLFGRNCIISRTGFSGERGYEIFAKADDIVAIWDGILEYGKSENVMTGSFNCIDAIRIEAGLLFYPFDMDESNSPWEVGLGFAVSRDKQADYRGKEACMNGIGKEKVKVCGIIADSDRVIDADAEVFKDGNKIGVVTGPNFSPALNKSLAIVKIVAEFSAIGTELEIKGSTNNCLATVHKLPIYNSDKTNRTTQKINNKLPAFLISDYSYDKILDISQR